MTGPYDLTTHDGKRVDWMTKAALMAAEQILGYPLSVTQGSYNAGKVSASAGTHDGGGVVDLRAWDWEKKVRALRRVGFAAWHRTPGQGPWPEHIHAVLIGNQRLAPAAASQVASYLAGRNGLANNGADDGPRGFVDARFVWQGVPTPPADLALPVHGVDLSHHQTRELNLHAGMRAGVRWVYHKATEGTSYADPMYLRRRNEVTGTRLTRALRAFLLRRQLRFGAFHFAGPSKGDAAAEARWFLDRAKPAPGDMLPALDLEDDGGLSQAELTTWVRTFVRVVEHELGVKPIIYTPFDLDDTCGCLLWVARYHPSNADPRVPVPWKRWDVRQFSNGVTGVPHEVPGFGAVDLNTMRRGLRVRDLLIPKPHEEPPAPPLVEPTEPAKPRTFLLLGGDWNEGPRSTGRYSPSWIADQGGLHKPENWRGIDYPMTSATLSDVRRIPGSKAPGPGGSDHWMVAFTVTNPDTGQVLRGATWNMMRDRSDDMLAEALVFLEDTIRTERLDFVLLQEVRQYHAELGALAGVALVAATEPAGVEHNAILVRDGVTVDHPRFRLTSKVGWVTVTGAPHDPSAIALGTLNGWLRVGSVHEAVGVDWKAGLPVGPPRRVAARIASARDHARTGRRWAVS